MRYIAAYLLLQIGGNTSPKAGDITKLLSTVGIDCDSERLAKLLSELEGKSIDELIAAGSSKLASVPSGGGGGGGGGAPAAAASGGGGGGEAPKEEEKKEEPKVCPRTSNGSIRMGVNEVCDYRTSLTTIWASDCSTKRLLACLLVHDTPLESCCDYHILNMTVHSHALAAHKYGLQGLPKQVGKSSQYILEVPNWLDEES